MNGPIVQAHIDRSDCLWHPIISDDGGEIQISVGFGTSQEAIDYGREVYDDYRRLLAMKATTPSPSVDLPLSAQLQEAPHAK